MKRKLIEIILGIVIVLLSVLLIISIKEKLSIKTVLNYNSSKEKELSSEKQEKNLIFKDKSIYYTEGVGTTFTVDVTNSTEKFYLKGINVKLYNTDGKLLSSLYCNIDYYIDYEQTASCTVKTSKDIFDEYSYAEYTVYS